MFTIPKLWESKIEAVTSVVSLLTAQLWQKVEGQRSLYGDEYNLFTRNIVSITNQPSLMRRALIFSWEKALVIITLWKSQFLILLRWLLNFNMRLGRGRQTAARPSLYYELEGRTHHQESTKKACSTMLDPGLHGQGQPEQPWVFAVLGVQQAL